MNITGINRLIFGVESIPDCQRFFADWGLTAVRKSDDELIFETANGARVEAYPAQAEHLPTAIESGPTLREAVWSVEDQSALDDLNQHLSGHPNYVRNASRPTIIDHDGLSISFEIDRRCQVDMQGSPLNTVDNPRARVDCRSKVYDHAEPVSIGHYVLFCPDVERSLTFYAQTLGFVVSDYYPAGGYFLRCQQEGGHHQLFLLQTPDKKVGLNHVAFVVRDIHEVFGGGLHISRQGWSTQIGPGRHPVSSAYFWYVKSPTGGMFEYYSDEDWCTAAWQAKAWERTPEHFAEWAVDGGIDGFSRRPGVKR